MRFWDSSAVAPLLVSEAATAAVDELLASDSEMTVWWATVVECASAVARLERNRTVAAWEARDALANLDDFAGGWHEVPPGDVIRRNARRLLRSHALRAADALQLAGALAASEGDPGSLAFVSFDERLRDAAEREGFPVEPGS